MEFKFLNNKEKKSSTGKKIKKDIARVLTLINQDNY